MYKIKLQIYMEMPYTEGFTKKRVLLVLIVIMCFVALNSSSIGSRRSAAAATAFLRIFCRG